MAADDFSLAVLGDLHLDPSDMDCHISGRDHIKRLLYLERNSWVVSLGDLGAYGSAGTTENFKFSKEYLDGFGIPFELVTGNHDLEGLDEFETDEENLHAWMKCFGKVTPQFCVEIAEKVLLMGLSTVRFRDAPFSSHEVYIDPGQVAWFEEVLKVHPAEEGWKVLVFTHAPPMGSGLRVVQNVHIKNGCAWINHSSPKSERNAFRKACENYPQIKAWFSGHFHLSHDYQDSVSSAAGVAFIQVGVIGATSSRDGKRQSRIVKGNSQGLQIFTVNHHRGGDMRLDATVRFDESRGIMEAHQHEDYDHDNWFGAYVPQDEDGCYINSPDGFVGVNPLDGSKKICWWHMEDGAVLGVHDGMIVEYDSELLSPVGIVVDKNALHNRDVMVVEGGKALLLVPNNDTEEPEIIHPNQDGSYWRKFQRNKIVRQKEKEREALAKKYLEKMRQSQKK